MIITLVLVITISFGTLIGAIYDIKKGTIPNKLNFSLILLGIIINTILSITYWDMKYIEFSTILGIITFIFGYYLWKIGFWGGGDVKLITAIAIFLPFNPIIHNIKISYLNGFIPMIAIYPFPLTIFLNSIVLSLPFIIFYLVTINLKKTDTKIPKLTINVVKMIFNKKNLIKSILIFKKDILRLKTLKIIITSLIISIIIIYIKNIINNETKTVDLSFNLLLIILSIFIFSRLFRHLFKYLKNFLLNKSTITIPLNNIEEGMIIQNLQIPKELKDMVETKLKSLKIEYKSRVTEPLIDKDESQLIANSKHASGINEYEVEFLKDLANRELIKNRVNIKVAIPYGPSLFIGLISGIMFGDICSLLIAILKNIILKSIFN